MSEIKFDVDPNSLQTKDEAWESAHTWHEAQGNSRNGTNKKDTQQKPTIKKSPQR